MATLSPEWNEYSLLSAAADIITARIRAVFGDQLTGAEARARAWMLVNEARYGVSYGDYEIQLVAIRKYL